MMRVIATICEIAAPGNCRELIHDFTPRQPIACIHAAGPELERLTPEGWRVTRARCVGAQHPGEAEVPAPPGRFGRSS